MSFLQRLRQTLTPRPVSRYRGMVDDPRLTDETRKICAIWLDGRIAVAPGHKNNVDLNFLITELQSENVIPETHEWDTLSPREIGDAWADAMADDDNQASPEQIATTRRLLALAAEAKASDLIFEVSGDKCEILAIVLDQKISLADPMTRREGSQMMGYFFNNKADGSHQVTYHRTQFQGFSIPSTPQFRLPENVSSLRVQRGPHDPDGDHMYIRMLYRDTIKADTTLEDLGFSPAQAAQFARIRASLSGGVFMGGSTGDGKSTTLAVNLTLQQQEADGSLNIVTVEDPVEYPIPGAIQIAVPTTGVGEERAEHYRRALMHFCRVHPAAGMVSEIRDADAARQVLQFIDTGHQVWTTIHTHSANGILFRLLDMGVSPAEVCKPGNVAMLMRQTLIPVLCPECCLEEPPTPLPTWMPRPDSPAARYRNPAGCEACDRPERGPAARQKWAGYTRQIAVAETITPDDGYLDCVRDRNPSAAHRYWIENLAGDPVGDQVDRAVRGGVTDPVAALKKIGHAQPAPRPSLVAAAGER